MLDLMIPGKIKNGSRSWGLIPYQMVVLKFKHQYRKISCGKLESLKKKEESARGSNMGSKMVRLEDTGTNI